MTAMSAVADSILVVTSAEDLRHLRELLKLRGSFKVKIDIAGLAKERQARLQRSLERSVSACGCNEGTVAGLLYLIVVPILYFAGRIAPSALGWAGIGGGFIGVLVIGKLIGIAAARLTLARTLTRIEGALNANGENHGL